MEELAALIRKDWFVIDEAMNSPGKLVSVFKLSSSELDEILNALRSCVLEGIFEYKKNQITALLRPLQSLQYDSKAIELLPRQINRGRALLFVTLIQRLYCLKVIQPVSAKTSAGDTSGRSDPEISIKEILTFIQKEVREDPEKIKNPEIKKIIMYSKMYQQEIQKMKDLISSIPEGKKGSVKKNFMNSLNEILSKLNTAYTSLTEIRDGKTTEEKTDLILGRFDYSPLAPALKTQSRKFSEILSTLKFTEKEKFHTRELLVSLPAKQEDLLSLINSEQQMYIDIAPFDKNGLSAGKEFARGIHSFLRKEREWLTLHPWG